MSIWSWSTDTKDDTDAKAKALGYEDQTFFTGKSWAAKDINKNLNKVMKENLLSTNEINEARARTEHEKRRVQEKQVRALRRSYRAQGLGMLGVGNPASQDMSDQLGG